MHKTNSLTENELHLFNALYLAAGGVIVYTDWVDQYDVNEEVKFLLEFVVSALSMISMVRKMYIQTKFGCSTFIMLRRWVGREA